MATITKSVKDTGLLRNANGLGVLSTFDGSDDNRNAEGTP